ncbi:hypothetical protein HS088_TW09G00242 [Tripterygium wilfordii]|uniref:Gnk2-homologous domain-containing protein n=1 Tax=Tripterygium wilfordii TaxID=458696 RepID=A0A7J7D7I4_TRIWF|nr:hypothetical protein HS088_TW09G00242 [Tripterygium wilfordii]
MQFLKDKFEPLVSRVVALYRASNTARKFVTAESMFKKANIYSFVQCSPDISAGDCGKCLRKAIENLPSCCMGKIGGRVVFPSCFIRYEKYIFYDTTSSSKSKGSLRIIISVVVSVIFVVAVVLSGLIYWFLRTKKGKKHFHFVDEGNGDGFGGGKQGQSSAGCCLNCITMASQDILQLRPYDTEAVVWEEVCHLRYSNQNFIGHLDVTGNIGKDNFNNISQPKQFDSLVNVTVDPKICNHYLSEPAKHAGREAQQNSEEFREGGKTEYLPKLPSMTGT